MVKKTSLAYLRVICQAVMLLVPCPRTTCCMYIDPDRTSREPGRGDVTPSRPQAPSRNYVL